MQRCADRQENGRKALIVDRKSASGATWKEIRTRRANLQMGTTKGGRKREQAGNKG